MLIKDKTYKNLKNERNRYKNRLARAEKKIEQFEKWINYIQGHIPKEWNERINEHTIREFHSACNSVKFAIKK